MVNFVKLLRIVHFRYFTGPVDAFLELVVKNNFMRKSYQQLSDYLLGTIIFAHLLASIWLFIGDRSFNTKTGGLSGKLEQDAWMEANDDFKGASEFTKYIFAFYWVMETISTVGYGDYTAGT